MYHTPVPRFFSGFRVFLCGRTSVVARTRAAQGGRTLTGVEFGPMVFPWFPMVPDLSGPFFFCTSLDSGMTGPERIQEQRPSRARIRVFLTECRSDV